MKKGVFIFLLVPLSLFAQVHTSCPYHQYRDDPYVNPLYERYLSAYDVSFYHIGLEVSNKNTFIQGFTSITSAAVRQIDTIVFQIIDTLDVLLVEVNGENITGFIHKNDAVYIPSIIEKGETFSVTISYEGEAGQERGFFAGITSMLDSRNDQWVTYTLSEPLNAKDWFPVKQVLADKADSVWVDITVDKELMAGSIGLLEEIEAVSENKHKFKWRSDYPIAYYLISMAVADYRDYSFNAPLSAPGDSVLVQNFIYDDDAYFEKWNDEIARTSEMIKLFSELIIDYPFYKEKYGHAVAPMGGGMEHQTMTTIANFNFNLVAHELAHQWFGNSVTCGNWQDIWINEGFASYLEYIALQYIVNQEAADKWLQGSFAIAMAETGSVFVPSESVEDIPRVFDYGLSYKKGAALLHMIRYELDNDELFFHILTEYSEKYRNKVATATEFLAVLDSLSGSDFSCFFDQWYYGKGYPKFNLLWYKTADTLFVETLQETTSPETPLFKMTFDIGLQTDSGEKVIRLYQDKHEQLHAIPMKGNVWNLTFDPGKNLLAHGFIEMKMSDNQDVSIGPNPFESEVLIKMRKFNGNETYEIIDIHGIIIQEGEIASNPFRIKMDHLKNGSYILIMNSDHGSHKEKLIKTSQ